MHTEANDGRLIIGGHAVARTKTKQSRGRPRAISDDTRSEILQRIANGDKPADLQREYGIAGPTFRRTFSSETSKIKTQAVALATVELEIERMPFSAQTSIRLLADNLKITSNNLAAIAAVGSKNALTLRQKAAKQVEQLGDDFRLDGVDREGLKTIMALSQASNEELKPALDLVKTFKPETKDDAPIHTSDQLRRMADLMDRKR